MLTCPSRGRESPDDFTFCLEIGQEGTVALAEARARWTDTLGRVSDHEGQFSERVGKPGGRRHVGPEVVEAPAEVLDEGVPGDDDPSGSISLQSSGTTGPPGR
jgi:hypothetical protein